MRATFRNVTLLRTWRELCGDDCVPDEQMAPAKQSICTSRSFNGLVTDLETLRTHVANYAARCAEKLRRQQGVAAIVGTFLHTNPFRDDLPQYFNFAEQPLVTPSASTVTLTQAAHEALARLYRPGYHYKKAGVILLGITPSTPLQQDLFDINAEQFQKLRRLDAVVDRINRLQGSETVILGSQQNVRRDPATGLPVPGKADVFANAIRHDFRSKNPTTRWTDIIRLA